MTTLTSEMTHNELAHLCKQIHPGALILTQFKLSWRRPTSFFSWLVRRGTDEKNDRATVSHTALYFGIEAGIPMVIESSFRVRKYPLINYMGVNGQRCLIAQHRHVSEHLGTEIVSFALTFLGKRYGYAALGLVGLDVLFKTSFFTRRLEAKPDEMVCSTLGEQCYRHGGHLKIVEGKPAGSVTPDDQYDEVKRFRPPGQERWDEIYNGLDI